MPITYSLSLSNQCVPIDKDNNDYYNTIWPNRYMLVY